MIQIRRVAREFDAQTIAAVRPAVVVMAGDA
jgi:hypothetical protein